MLKGIDHLGVVLPSWEQAKQFFVGVLGMEVDRERTPTDDGVYMAPERLRIFFCRAWTSPVRIEVLVPQDDTSGTARLLQKRGPGLHHVCFISDDLERDSALLREKGVQQIDLSHGLGDLLSSAGAAFFHPKSCEGILTEIIPEKLAR